jgi:hypothetical protein
MKLFINKYIHKCIQNYNTIKLSFIQSREFRYFIVLMEAL